VSLALGGDVRVGELERLPGGASREIWAFNADGRELILRRDPPGRPSAPGTMAVEAAAMRAAARAGLAVPEVVLVDDGRVLATAGLIMSRVPGEAVARRILRDDDFAPAREGLTEELAAFLAGLHGISPAEVPGITRRDALADLRSIYDRLNDVSPMFEATFRWLHVHRPESHSVAIAHGDLRLGNVIVGPEGLRAVIDWELVHVGEPIEDLAWLCVKAWRFGGPKPVAGVGTVDDLIRAYVAAGGRPVDRRAFHWWLVMGTLRWGVMCMVQASAHLDGGIRSIELAAIGRRVCEQEWDLLELLAPHAWAAAREAPPDDRKRDADPGLHGRPTAGQLVEATRALIAEELITATDGRLRYNTRIAANVLAMVERELEFGEAQEARFVIGLAALDAGGARQLAEAIGRGEYDGRQQEVFALLANTVRDRLFVANPRRLEQS
jgi:aminoglycoside phosphotransferase (APT) family kinase protein